MSDSFKTLLSRIQEPNVTDENGVLNDKVNDAIGATFIVSSKCTTMLDIIFRKKTEWVAKAERAIDAHNSQLPTETLLSDKYVDEDGNAQMRHPDEQPAADGSRFSDVMMASLNTSEYDAIASAEFWTECYTLAQMSHFEMTGAKGTPEVGFAKDDKDNPNYITREERYAPKLRVVVEQKKPTKKLVAKRQKTLATAKSRNAALQEQLEVCKLNAQALAS